MDCLRRMRDRCFGFAKLTGLRSQKPLSVVEYLQRVRLPPVAPAAGSLRRKSTRLSTLTYLSFFGALQYESQLTIWTGEKPAY
jgi:hypothetical protein